jgi:hypothetical protein|tara:strand:+ start:3222 stop:3455 length:234 start_codon:yes stop_codon:yes gene_type:complete
MRKILLVTILLGSGCKSGGIDEKGRLEKVRIQIPAFIDIEFEYYKDKENIGKGTPQNIYTNLPPFEEYPKLMKRTQK